MVTCGGEVVNTWDPSTAVRNFQSYEKLTQDCLMQQGHSQVHTQRKAIHSLYNTPTKPHKLIPEKHPDVCQLVGAETV